MPTHLVVVESPTKAKTIKRFLGKEFIVEASMGHVRDLPESTLGVDTKNDFEAEYVVPDGKKPVVKKLKDLLKKADDLWIATDEDREGEAIGWHLTQVLGIKKSETVKRIVFHEITESAIQAAVASPRTIDQKLVDAQQARRVLDRLVGYTLSPFLWKKVYRGLSAGRVQSVAVRILVDREREIRAFKPDEYWTIGALLEKGDGQEVKAHLSRRGDEKFVPGTEAESQAVVAAVKGQPFTVADVEEKQLTRSPTAPFTTSTLQQEAGRKLGFSVKQTMVVAQQLYEGVHLGKGEGMMGLITYMRTDSVHMSEKALADAKETIEKLYGREYVLAEPRQFKTKAKGAQEAHEAIRPTELSRTPESLKSILDTQQLKLYTLIWNRTLASQMPLAELRRVGVDITAAGYTFRATGQTITFDGFLRVYQEGRDDEENTEDEGEKILPPMTVGENLTLQRLEPEQHFTKPPARYTEASLVKKLEEEGIGRPSTYAPTISTIIARGYVIKEGKQLVPQDVAFAVTDLLKEHFPDIVNLQFTANMEQSLDHIAEGKVNSTTFLKSFFSPFSKLVEQKTEEVSKKDVLKEREIGLDPATGLPVIVRLGRFGPYVQLGRMPEGKKLKKEEKPKSASLAKNLMMDTVTLEQALGLLSFPREVGKRNGIPVLVAIGRFGPYVKCGEETATLPKDADPLTFDLEQALLAISQKEENQRKAKEPLKVFGKDPESGKDLMLKDGRYGPYVTDGVTNASLGKKLSPDTLTFEQAVELLKKKRARGPSKWKRRS